METMKFYTEEEINTSEKRILRKERDLKQI